MTLRRVLPLMLIGLLLFSSTGGALAQAPGPAAPQASAALPGTGFTYQGSLNSGGGAVTATCNFQFGLYDALSGGAQLGNTQTVSGVSVAGGRFTVTLNAGGEFGPRAFDGSARWLAIAVQCPPDAGYTPLTPRQPLTPSPLAFALPGLRTEQYITSTNVIGGHISNTVSAGVVGAAIGGGGSSANPNSVTADYGTVGGGRDNRAAAPGATVGGGGYYGGANVNGNEAWGDASTIAGGYGNIITPTNLSDAAFIGGGEVNEINGSAGVIGGGFNNQIHLAASLTVIVGGQNNDATGIGNFIGGGSEHDTAGSFATVAGGTNNDVSASNGSILGGWNNVVSANGGSILGGQSNIVTGTHGTVLGGRENAAGDNAVALGWGAKAVHNGSLAWTCAACAYLFSSAQNAAFLNATNGFWLGNIASGSTITPAIGAGNFISTSTGARLTTAGVWTNSSDRSAKHDFAAVDSVAILDTLMGVPIETWTYYAEADGIRHLGPTAQDFYAAFGLGDSDRTIGTVDADGVALAAIQGLYSVVQEKETRIAALEAQVAALQTTVETSRRDVFTGAETSRRDVSTDAAQLALVLVVGLLAGAGIAAGAFALGMQWRGVALGRRERG